MWEYEVIQEEKPTLSPGMSHHYAWDDFLGFRFHILQQNYYFLPCGMIR